MNTGKNSEQLELYNETGGLIEVRICHTTFVLSTQTNVSFRVQLLEIRCIHDLCRISSNYFVDSIKAWRKHFFYR